MDAHTLTILYTKSKFQKKELFLINFTKKSSFERSLDVMTLLAMTLLQPAPELTDW